MSLVGASAREIPFPYNGQTIKHGKFSWKVVRCLYSGPFSDVFVIADARRPSQQYAMKVERVAGIQRPVLKLDAHVLPHLKGKRGFPDLLVSCRTATFKFCVMQLLGPDMARLRRAMPQGRFTPATALNVGIQTLSLLETLHHTGWLCRDVKAPNLAVGRGDDASTVYMLDFGFARRFLNKDQQYRPQRTAAPCLGTMPYAPIAAHLRREQCPRDDVESWFYMLCELFLGELPWQHYGHGTILEFKLHIRTAGHHEFFRQLPRQFAEILRVIDDTDFYDKPMYGYLRYLIESAAETYNIDLKAPLDWVANPAVYAVAVAREGAAPASYVPADMNERSPVGSIRALA